MAIPTIETVLRSPRLVDRGGRCAALPALESVADERTMAIVPGGFDQDPSQMSIAGFGNRPARMFGTAGMFGRHESDKGHRAGRGRESTGITQFGGDRECGQIIDAAKAPQTLDARSQR